MFLVYVISIYFVKLLDDKLALFIGVLELRINAYYILFQYSNTPTLRYSKFPFDWAYSPIFLVFIFAFKSLRLYPSPGVTLILPMLYVLGSVYPLMIFRVLPRR